MKGIISPIRSLGDIISNCPTSKLDKTLEYELNKPLLSLAIPSSELLIINLKLSNRLNFLTKRYKPLFSLTTSLTKIPIIKLKKSDKRNSYKTRNFSSVSNDILKICHNRLDFLRLPSMLLNKSLFLKLLSSNKKIKER